MMKQNADFTPAMHDRFTNHPETFGLVSTGCSKIHRLRRTQTASEWLGSGVIVEMLANRKIYLI